MNIIAQFTARGATIGVIVGLLLAGRGYWRAHYLMHIEFAIYKVLFVLFVYVLLYGTGGALIGAFVGAVIRLARKRNAPAVQYDAPQEGVWPPPPTVPGDAEKENTT